MLLTVWLLHVSCEGFLRDQQIAQHSWKYFSLTGCACSLLCGLLADCWESPGFAAHQAVGWMCVWPWGGPAKLHHLRLCFALTLWFLSLTLLWPCPAAAVRESCCLPSPRLECLYEGVGYFKPKRSSWVCKWWNRLERKPCAIWDSSPSLLSMLKIGHCPNLDSFLWLLVAELSASLQWDLPDEKLVIWLGGQFEVISKCKTGSFMWVCDQLWSSLKTGPKEMGFNSWKNLGWKNYFQGGD